MDNIVSNCPLCGEHSLHLSSDQELNFMQCISCGYVSSDKFKGTIENNEEYKKLDELLQKWVKVTDDRLWIPIQMTLPFGMVYPALVDNDMKWVFAKSIEIPEEEQKNYPIPDKEGEFYKMRYETDTPQFYDKYSEALAFIQQFIKSETEKAAKENGVTKIKLPKLKKVK